MNRSYKILVIEDEDDWIHLLKRILEEEGCRVTFCKSADEALLTMSRELFHFATIDLKLLENVQNYHNLDQSNKWKGWEILRFIKEKSLNKTMGTMVVTFYPEKEFMNKAIKELGATYFMSKRNFDTEVFIKTLRHYLDEFSRTYFYEGILQNSHLSTNKTAYSETDKFEAAYRSVEGLRNYFRTKEEAGLKTIIFYSDLCDSLSYKDQRGFVEGLFKCFSHNDKVAKILKDYGGTVIKTIGDCVMGRFDTNKQNQGESATNALNAAIKIHELFDDLNVGINKDLERYRSKIGISIGITGDSFSKDPHGMPVDIAARLTSLAKPEQILVSKELVETANITQIKTRAIQPPLRLKPQDLISEFQNRKLKGIENPVPICEIKWDGKERGIQELLQIH